MFEANKSMLRSVFILLLLAAPLRAYEVVEVEGQPLAAQAIRLVDAFEFLGSPLDKNTLEGLKKACEVRDAAKIQQILDPLTLVNININPEARVKAARGKAHSYPQLSGGVVRAEETCALNEQVKRKPSPPKDFHSWSRITIASDVAASFSDQQ